MTTQAQVDAMRAFCARLQDEPLISTAHLDDWGRHGNFQVLLIPQEPNRHTTRRISALVKRLLDSEKVGAHLRQVFRPDPVVRKNPFGRREVIGYARDHWTIDIDFQTYHAASNTFSN